MPRLRFLLPLALCLFVAAEWSMVDGPVEAAAPAALPGPARLARKPAFARRVVVVVLDAWRRVDALDNARMPRVARLARKGSRGIILTPTRTFTQAALRRMMTGRTSSLRDVLLNQTENEVGVDNLFADLNAARIEWGVAAFAPAFAQLFGDEARPGSLAVLWTKEHSPDPDDIARDAWVEEQAMRFLADPARELVVVHFGGLDMAAHLHTPRSEIYTRTLLSLDRRVEKVAASLDLARDTMIVLGDHGVNDGGSHGGPELQARETAYLALGAGIRPSNLPMDQTDLADLVATLLGVCPPAGSTGAPDPKILAIDARELKARCDRCLLARLGVGRGARRAWLATSEAKRYLREPAFTRSVAERYRRIVAPGASDDWDAPEGTLGATMAAVGLLALAGLGRRA